jgi:7-keto-8-aminopelargonate synthetase-like enzyme
LGTKVLCQQLTLVTKMMCICDVDAHACIIDGVRLHGKRFTYRHHDLAVWKTERATKLAGSNRRRNSSEGVLECAVSKVN